MIQCHTKQLSHSNDEILGGNLDKVKHLNKWNGIQSYHLTGLQNKQFTVSPASLLTPSFLSPHLISSKKA